ncbi:hypothetical protein N7481_006961 [Penicillium waksmanii]|uniref:uncharacterized protein n=1 Tax=Penicillium waksmanii TaxID=69791 RepID=UPI002548C15B|nr:uncharacterized protein N7481_006961 [Penicillium waksmanii]KAJ5979663.1 hypothetical protein N7481_006961 [Penicillium waksmanii]
MRCAAMRCRVRKFADGRDDMCSGAARGGVTVAHMDAENYQTDMHTTTQSSSRSKRKIFMVS